MESQASFPRLFTVIEANDLLPKLRPLVEQVLENIRRLKGASESVVRREGLDPEAPNLMNRLRDDGEIAKLIGQVKGCVEHVEQAQGLRPPLLQIKAASMRSMAMDAFVKVWSKA